MRSVDFYQIEELLGHEERMVRDSAAAFVDREVLPIIRDCFEKGTFPRQLVKKMGENGFLGATVDGYGGTRVSPVAYGLMMQEFERGDSGLRSFASVQSGLVIGLIDRYGSAEQKERWLPGLIGGDLIGCFALTEPDFGSDPSGMKTRAVQEGGHFILNGAKAWITSACMADCFVVWAYLDDKVRGFIVEKDTPGMKVMPILHKFSMRASDTGEIHFNDCRIPLDNILERTEGLVSALSCLNHARYGIAWGVLGAAQACYEEALEYARVRVMFGKPIGAFQLVQEKLTDMVTGITCGQLLCLQLGRLMEKGGADHAQISLAKRNNVRVALEVARKSRDILGASGISTEYNSIRHMLNLESVITYEGTDSIHTLIIGKKVTGLDAIH